MASARRMRLGEEGIAAIRPRRREYLHLPAVEQRADLVLCSAYGRGGGNDLGTDFLALDRPRAKLIQGGLVESDHAAHGAGDQVELVLDDQVRWSERIRQRMTTTLFTRPIEAIRIVPARPAEEPTDRTGPWHGREFVDCRDQETGQAVIDRFVDRQDRQRGVAREVASTIDTHDAQVDRCFGAGDKLERLGLELLAAPGAVLQGNGSRLSIVILKRDRLAVGTVRVSIPGAAHAIGRGSSADPEADLERPRAEGVRVLQPLQLQSTDQGRSAAELIKGQKTEGVSHQHAQADRGIPGILEPSMHQDKCRKAEVSLGLAAAGREEE